MEIKEILKCCLGRIEPFNFTYHYEWVLSFPDPKTSSCGLHISKTTTIHSGSVCILSIPEYF